MIPNISEKINSYLRQNHLTPLYPFVPNKKTVYRKDFVISWTHNYTTVVKRNSKEYFFKVALEPKRYNDLERQVRFMQLLNQQKNLTFRVPKLYEWNTSDNFYFYLREKMNGVLLGNCVRAKREFATKSIMSELNSGFKEVNGLKMAVDNLWHQTKDANWLKDNISRTDENETIKTILGPVLWQKIRDFILNTKYLILDTSPLWGDPAPNNFLVENGRLSIIDYAPFTCGYEQADFAEFASFCIFSPEWRKFLTMEPFNHIAIQPFFIVFLIDRISSVLWLDSKGQLKIQLKKPKEYYLETIKNHLISLLLRRAPRL